LRNGQAESTYIYVVVDSPCMEEESPCPVRVNILSIIGAALAIASLAMPWFSSTAYYGPLGSIGRTFDYGLFGEFYGPLSLASLLFVIGTLVAFGSPAGGFLQLSGIIISFAGVRGLLSRTLLMRQYPPYFTARIELGTLVGVIAVSIVLVSLLLPVWIGLRPRRMGTHRFATVFFGAAPATVSKNEGGEAKSEPAAVALANSVCLAGAFLGLLSFIIPWMQTRGGGSLAAPLGDFMTGAQTLVDSPAMVIGAFCFLIGSLLAIVSVAGGLVQLAGITSFLIGTLSLGQSEFYSWQGSFVLATGFYLGAMSTAIVAFSLVIQWLLHRKEKGRSLGSVQWVWRRVQPLRTSDGSSHEMVSQMNILGFIGAILGVVAILVSWESSYGPSSVGHVNAIQLALYGTPDELTICSVAFIIGTVIALLTPVGGVIQIASSFGFLVFLPHSIEVHQAVYGTSLTYGIGPFLGLLSGLLVLRSLWFPSWLQLRSGLALASPRLFVVSAAPVLGSRLLFSRHSISIDVPAKRSFWRDARINVACLAGAVTGLVACGLLWSQYLSPSDFLEADLLGYGVNWGTSAGSTDLMFMIFFCGSMIALVSTLGCALQLVGLLGFVFSSGTFHGFLWEGVVEWGFGLAVISFLLIVASILHPWGPGNLHVKNTLATRLLVWGGPPSIANEHQDDVSIS
jgi:hypothetical protein